MDVLKTSFKGFQSEFGRVELRSTLVDMLRDQIMQVCMDVYGGVTGLVMGKECRSFADDHDGAWQRRLDSAAGALTKSGLGRGLCGNIV